MVIIVKAFNMVLSWPKVPLGLRFFLVYFVFVIVTGYLVSSTLLKEIKPAIRQATEETLVDMAHLLAVMASHEMQSGTLSQSAFSEKLVEYGKRQPIADIWGINKASVSHRIYITNEKGMVIADSWQKDIGADFSKWNDVYLTLRGQYGARSTALDPNDPLSTIMHVAAPIYDNGNIIGSVTVAKANRSVQPFIERSKKRVLKWFILISILALIIGALFAWRIHAAVNKLTEYAERTGAGEHLKKPKFRVFYEYRKLSNALEKMRNQLDGKQYVEEYVQSLTHELKSPLSAIKGASEILQMPLNHEKHVLFAHNIEHESERMQQLIDKLLALSKLEKQPDIIYHTHDLKTLIEQIIDGRLVRLNEKKLTIKLQMQTSHFINGDAFLVSQALTNLIDNACDFSLDEHEICLGVMQEGKNIIISVTNYGPHIPDYALTRVTERFYSLPRDTGKKSTGLGLSFVKEIMNLHQGELKITNQKNGVCAQLIFPAP